jgi:hypothetical protein
MYLRTETGTGWHPKGCVDLILERGVACGLCQQCGKTGLRFLHSVENAEGDVLKVGSECARHLCNGYPAKDEERRLINRWARRTRWLKRSWATSSKGNPYLRFEHEGRVVLVTVYPNQRFGGWSFCLKIGRDEPVYGSGRYDREAKLAAFDRLAELLHW